MHDHSTHQHKSLNKVAFSATLHCLTGCAVGEVLGMILSTALNWGNTPSIALSVILAFIFGYSFTTFPLLRAGMSLGAAMSLALASDTVSISVMELVDNATILVIPGAMSAGLNTTLFWASLAVSLVIAGAAAYPVNRWLISRGKGHALVHSHH